MKKYLLAAVIVTSGISILPGQSDADLTRSTLSQNTIKGHIYFLASDELRGRQTGSAEIDIAAQYLANTFRKYGVQPVPGAVEGYFQPVMLESVQPATQLSLTIDDFTSNELIMIKGQNTTLEKDLVFMGYGLEEDYKENIKGKIVVALAGAEGRADPNSLFEMAAVKRKMAMEKGANGLIEINALDPSTWGRFGSFFNNGKLAAKASDDGDFLHLWVRDESGTIEKKTKKKAKGKLSISGMVKNEISAKNVVGMVEGTDPVLKNEFVIYSAHYDHIGVGRPDAKGDSIYNGARDNAVGTVTVLSAAENIAKHPTKRSALFILFTAEEKGLLGSKWYVDHPLIPLDQAVYCFNSDNGGYNDTSIATIIGLGRTTAAENIKSACQEFGLRAMDDPSPEHGLFDRSDNVNFAMKGIPAPTFSLGFTAFDAEILKYYHQAADNPGSLDYDYLEKFFGAYVLACRKIANDANTPFWVEGDKYHGAGKALYGVK